MTHSPLLSLAQRVLTTLFCLLLSERLWAADAPSNVARLATVTARSERNERLAARFVADGTRAVTHDFALVLLEANE